MSTISTTGPFERANVDISVRNGGALGDPTTSGYVVISVYAGACSLQTYLTVAQARKLAAELAATAAQIDIGAQAAPRAVGAGVPA